MMRVILAGLGLLAAIGAPAKAEELHIQHCLRGCALSINPSNSTLAVLGFLGDVGRTGGTRGTPDG